jgi:hypothetical protein
VLIADPAAAGYEFSQFQIFFTDKNGNGLVDFPEITSFSGVRQTTDSTLPLLQTTLLGMPGLAGFTVAGIAPGSNASTNAWYFTASSDNQWQIGEAADSWTYQMQLSEEPAPIPLPATALLLGAAVAGLAGLRRKTRTA